MNSSSVTYLTFEIQNFHVKADVGFEVMFIQESLPTVVTFIFVLSLVY